MKTAVSYFRYQLKSNLRPLIIITVFAMIICFSVCTASQHTYKYRYYTDTGYVSDIIIGDEEPYQHHNPQGLSEFVESYQTVLSNTTFWLMALSFAVPIWQFAFFKKRRNLDCCYSLPISRKQLALVHYLVGLVLVYVPFLATYLQTIIHIIVGGGWGYLHHEYILWHFLTSMLFAWLNYSIFVFAFNEANTVMDGIIFITLWTYVIAIVGSAVDTRLFEGRFSILWIFFGFISEAFIEAAETTTYSLYSPVDYEFYYQIGWSIFWLLLGIAATILFFKRFGKSRTEKVEGVSDSVFGYKIMIPLWVIPLVIYRDKWTKAIEISSSNCLFALIIAFVGYIIYRRGFRFKASDIAVLGTIAALMFLSFTADGGTISIPY